MIDLQNVMTSRLQKLIDEAVASRPEDPLVFEVMTDKKLLKDSSGAAIVEDESGETIYLDPERFNEYSIAHELMHSILHRTYWPRMYSIVPDDPFVKRLADSLDNSLDHHVFNPRMKELGFNHEMYTDPFISTLEGWPSQEVKGERFVANSLKLFDGLMFSPKLRKNVITTVGKKQPKMLKLARQLQHVASPAGTRKKAGVRQAMVALVDFLEKWIVDDGGPEFNLRMRIGISPLFTKRQFRERASMHIDLESHPLRVNDKEYWVGGLVLRADGTSVQNYVFTGPIIEPPMINEIRKRLETLNVEEFIETENIKYGTYP